MSQLLIKRFKALGIDLAVAGLVGIVINSLALLKLDHLPFPNEIKLYGIIALLFFVFDMLSTLIKNQSLGHQMMGLHVKFEDDQITMKYSRSLIKTLSVFTIFLGAMSVFMMRKNKNDFALHDLISRSQVWTN